MHGTQQREKMDTSFGKRVRQKRQEQMLTLQHVSKRSGLAISTLSKIENGQISPTYENLLRLAEGLGVELTNLFKQRADTGPSSRRSITRKGEGVIHESPQYNYEMLCVDISKKDFIPLMGTIKARTPSLIRHPGEEFVYVLSGEVEIYTDGYKTFNLKEGDSCYFDSNMGHSLVSVSKEDAKVLWVCSRVVAPLEA